jgi:hypothetical protein
VPDSFADFLRAALACIGHETPGIHRRLLDVLGTRTIAIEVDAEPFTLAVVRGQWRCEPLGPADVEARSTLAHVHALLTGVDTLEDAVLEGRVHLRGTLDDLLVVDDALQLFTQAAVRAPGILGIRRRWDDHVRALEEGRVGP